MNKQVSHIKLTDPFLFLIGNRGAITRLAGSWFTLLIGAILVATAAVARNYDHHYFLAEWQWLYGPFIASVITSLIIFFIGLPFASFRKSTLKNYLSFLSLYWMTAPCAWIYAIPVESFTSILTATKWNISFLAIVSLWRVFLMARCIQILSGENFYSSLVRIALPASAVMCIASLLKGMDLVGIMGGVKLSPEETILSTAANFTTITCFWLCIFSVIFTVSLIQYRSKIGHLPFPWRQAPLNKKILLYYVLLIPLALATSFPTQQKAQRNYTLKQLLQNHSPTGADASIKYASQFERADFLASHHFPPGPKQHHKVQDLLLHLKSDDPAWIRSEWEEILREKTEHDSREEFIKYLQEQHDQGYKNKRNKKRLSEWAPQLLTLRQKSYSSKRDNPQLTEEIKGYHSEENLKP